jgi:hypothetical protein
LKIRGQGLLSLASGRVVGARGAPARGIEVIVGPGTDVERQMTLVVKADALAGQYTILGVAPDGSGSMLPFVGAMDLTVLDSKAGQSPLGAMMGMIGASRPPGMPGGGIASGGTAPDRSSLAGSVGLPTGDIRGTPDFSSYKPGDGRLMAGDEKPEDPPPTDVTSTAEASDQTSSDGTTKITSAVTTTSSDGTWMVDVMTFTRDASGNTTETQTVKSGNAKGETGYSHTCTGKCTPVPNQGGCSGDKACEKASAQFQAAFPLLGAMEKRFVESRFGSLGGNSTDPGGATGNRKPPTRAAGRDAILQKASPYINPNPEGGSSSGSGSEVKVTPTTKPRTGQPKPIDPSGGTTPPSPTPTPTPR